MELRSTNNTYPSPFRNLDWFTIILYTILVIAGAICIYSASYDFDNGGSMFDFEKFSGKQFLWIGLSFVVGFSLLLIERRFYDAYAYPAYVIMILVLILTIFIAPNVKGSHSWIVLGPVSLQPAEFAKTTTALALAKLFSGYNFVLNKSFKNYLKAGALIFLPFVIIILQNETGSALVYASLIFMLYREGMSGFVLYSALCAIVIFVVAMIYSATVTMGIPTGQFIVFVMIMTLMVGMLFVYCRSFILGRNVLLGFVGSALVAGALYFFGIEFSGYIYFGIVISAAVIYLLIGMFHDNINKVLITIIFAVASISFLFCVNFAFDQLQPHQQRRIQVALGIEQDIRGAGYNVNQSKIAIGSGGLTGRGYLKGTQTKLKYVPEQHTDFIFCTIGEELGFVGGTTVMVLFLILILRIITIAERQRTAFGRVFAYCVASYFILHFCINLGMVLGLCPVIGIPLPFFSYGGSSLWGFTIMLFIMLRLDATRKDFGNY